MSIYCYRIKYKRGQDEFMTGSMTQIQAHRQAELLRKDGATEVRIIKEGSGQ